MKSLNVKKITFASALVIGNVFPLVASAQVVMLYSGAPGTLDGNNGNSIISSVTLSGAQTINYTLTGLVVSGPSSVTFRLGSGLASSPTNVGSFTRSLTGASATYTGSFSATGAASNLYYISTGPHVLSITNLVLTYGSSQTQAGPSSSDTQQSLNNTVSVLRSAYALQSTVLINGFSYDCPVFDKNGVCVSTGGRYSTTNANSVSTTSALLIGAYRLSKQIRVGGYVDQNLSSSNNTINFSNSKPMIGLFGVWNERPDGIGTEVKVSAGYGAKDTAITRQVVGTSEAGGGGSALNTTGAQITAKYNMVAIDKTIVSPYVGIRYIQNRMNGYVEATNSNVTAPLTYSALNTDATTAIAGVAVKYQLDPTVALLASAGVENDLSINNGTYSATGVNGLTAINFNANPAKTRATFSAGAHYDIDKRQRVSLTGIYREEAYRSVNTTAVFATYMVGF